MKASDYNVFISYKSDEVHGVRLIAEHLIACGLKVWLDEYDININDRKLFMSAIDAAIQNCTHFIFFSSKQYFESKYCMHELQSIKRRSDVWPLKSLELRDINCLDIEVSNESKGAEIIQQYFDFTDEAVCRKLWPKLSQFLKFEIPFDPPALRSMRTKHVFPSFSVGNLSFALACPGWEQTNSKKGLKLNWRGRIRPVKFKYIFGPRKVECELNIKFIGEPENFVYSQGRTHFEHFIEIAKLVQNQRTNCIGVHLIEIDGNSHIAFTHRLNGKLFVRDYAIMTEKTYGEDSIYLHFRFKIFGSFQDFCRMARWMDDLVYSLSMD